MRSVMRLAASVLALVAGGAAMCLGGDAGLAPWASNTHSSDAPKKANLHATRESTAAFASSAILIRTGAWG